MRVVVGLLLLSASAAWAGEDFTQRSSCEGAWLFRACGTGGDTNCEDTCAGAGQDGANDGTAGSNLAQDCGEIPSGSNAAACSLNATGNASNQVVSVTSSTAFNAASMTAGCWIRYTGVDAHGDIIIEKGQFSAGNSFYLEIFENGADDFELYANVNGTWSPDAAQGPDVTTNTWHHVVMRYDADGSVGRTDRIDTFVDGNRDCTGGSGGDCPQDTTGPNASNANDLFMFENNADWQGYLTECFYLSEALTDEEICQVCRCGLADDTSQDRVTTCGSCTIPAGQRCQAARRTFVVE